MTFSPELIALSRYLAGQFDNREQAIEAPAWYVHLCLWHRPVPLFQEDSFTIYAEQANIVNLNKPYRPRILRLKPSAEDRSTLQVQYYMLKDPEAVRGCGRAPEPLQSLTLDRLELLPSCALTIKWRQLNSHSYHFQAALPPDTLCCFTYGGENYQISLGFEVSSEEFLSYDKGIDPVTGKAKWGALLGPFRFTKRQDFSAELPL